MLEAKKGLARSSYSETAHSDEEDSERNRRWMPREQEEKDRGVVGEG